VGKETVFTLSMMRRKSHVIITVELKLGRVLMNYKRGHTFVLTIFLLLNIVKRKLLIRVTRVYIEGQIMS
jgi:hypothetical protein